MGQGGLDPDYFLRRMRRGEAADWAEGFGRRERGAWERARLLTDATARLLTGKGAGIRYPWDTEAADERPLSAEELARARREARAAEEWLRKRLGRKLKKEEDGGK